MTFFPELHLHVMTASNPSHGGLADLAEDGVTLEDLWFSNPNPDEARSSKFETQRSSLVSVAAIFFP